MEELKIKIVELLSEKSRPWGCDLIVEELKQRNFPTSHGSVWLALNDLVAGGRVNIDWQTKSKNGKFFKLYRI